MMANEPAETTQIEKDLAQTRARMDRRLDALQDHLTPRQLVNDAFAYFRGADGADFTRDLVARTKANPVPAALIGIGVAWLAATSRQSAATTRAIPRPRPTHAGVLVRKPSEEEAAYRPRPADAQAVARISYPQGDTSMNRSPARKLSSVGNSPIALGAIAAVVGLVAGALIPTTEQEEKALGSTAGRVRAAGRDLAQDAVERGGQVANDALAAVKESASAESAG